MKQQFLLIVLFCTNFLFGQNACPPIIETSSNPKPSMYSVSTKSVVSKNYIPDICKAKHPNYTGVLRYYEDQEDIVERTKEVRINAILDGCYNIVEIVSVDTIETGTKVRKMSYGNCWTVRFEYLKTPAKNRPKDFLVSQLNDGNWITHYGVYETKYDADRALIGLIKLYPQFCKMYVTYIPSVLAQGIYE